jgi:hypothetical protein
LSVVVAISVNVESMETIFADIEEKLKIKPKLAFLVDKYGRTALVPSSDILAVDDRIYFRVETDDFSFGVPLGRNIT